MKFTLHIGLPKTGTTSLQLMLRHANDITLFHKNAGKDAKLVCEAFKSASRDDRFLGLTQKRLKKVQDILTTAVKTTATSGNSIVISDENISMRALEIWEGAESHPDIVSERLHRFILDNFDFSVAPQILIGMREPALWLASRFGKYAFRRFEHSKTEETKTQVQTEFESFLSGIASSTNLLPALLWLEPSTVSEVFSSRFGDNQVKLYSLDSLSAEPDSTLRELEAFVGSTNISAHYGVHGHRNVSQISQSTWSYKGTEYNLPNELRQRVNARFVKSCS